MIGGLGWPARFNGLANRSWGLSCRLDLPPEAEYAYLPTLDASSLRGLSLARQGGRGAALLTNGVVNHRRDVGAMVQASAAYTSFALHRTHDAWVST